MNVPVLPSRGTHTYTFHSFCESRLPENITNSVMNDILIAERKIERTKEHLECEREESEKFDLKLNIQKT